MSKQTKPLAAIFWVAIVLLGAWAYAVLALRRGEPVNSAYILIAALCSYAIGFRFYSKWIAARVLALNDRRATPCEAHDDGRDFVRTNKWIVFGHHFAAISGPGPLVGPVLAAQFGYLPGALWILIGVVLGGAVQDFVILFCSMRRDGKSLGQMAREELNTLAGWLALVAILAIMVILLAVLALVVVKALAESPWGVFTVGATIPIALLMGTYLRCWRVGNVREATVMGVVLLLLAVWGGKYAHTTPSWAKAFTLGAEPLAWGIIFYGLAASVLPVWLLLAPRDYLSTFMKLGTIFALVLGIFLVLPDLQMHAVSRFVDGTGPVLAGKLFPFCFITIACGAISGFHSLISSGTTPKLVTRETYARPIGYGAMCLESLVAIMALIAACTLDPGVYFSMNVKGDPAATVAKISSLGFPVTVDGMNQLAATVGEQTLFGRTGGAATLAVGMAHIFAKAVHGRWLDLWYHFAIMFEALFILTTLDAGTRVGRYLLQDVLGTLWKPLGDTRSLTANSVASILMVAAWGYFLIQGVRDPLGGINSLWPLFGIANQLLAAMALCLATTIILKMQLQDNLQLRPLAAPWEHEPGRLLSRPAGTLSSADSGGEGRGAEVPFAGGFMDTPVSQRDASKPGRPAMALVTLVPLVWLLAVTVTAGLEKVYSADPRIGFLAQARSLGQQLPALQQDLTAAQSAGAADGLAAARTALATNRTLHFNQMLDAFVAGLFLVLVVMIVLLCLREWVLLVARKRLATLRETAPVWLPDYALVQEKPLRLLGLLALALALAKELSGEADLEHARHAAHLCEHCVPSDQPGAKLDSADPRPAAHLRQQDRRLYVRVTEERFTGVNRCC